MSSVIQVAPLPATGPWPTVDPFLFCVHHNDRFPRSNGQLCPAAPLSGRALGNDFSNIDGWNMYHGRTVPGFPQHPHRGFETITFVQRGLIDHADSLGAVARYGEGDVQWMTAGAGIVHAEMFPLLDEVEPNPMDMFQIWLNLPRADKMATPYFEMLWADGIPHVIEVDGNGCITEITVAAGALGDAHPPSPPPDSWASKDVSDIAIWHIRIDPGGSWVIPPAAGADTVRILYVVEGDGTAGVESAALPGRHAAQLDASVGTPLRAGEHGLRALLLQGRPIAEPVAQYGPFVMNDRAGIEQAFRDYQRTGFGGWPWPSDDPTNGFGHQRFARRPNGDTETAP